MKTMNVMSGFKALALSAVFSAMFFVGCEQPVSSVVAGGDVAMSYAKGSGDGILGGDAKPLDFGRIFGQLNLTVEQRAQIDILKHQQHDCEKTAMDVLKASERTIQESFKAQRQTIEAGVKAGTITKAEARAQMHALEVAQKEAMVNNPARATAQAAVTACRETFLAGVRAALTAEQLVTFEAWLANPTNGGGKDGGPKGGDKGDKGDKRDGTFKKLNLTGEQQGAIDILIQQRKACEDQAIAAVRAAEQAVLAPFKAERQAIEAALKAGTITREEAHTQMQGVDVRQKAAMQADATLTAARATLKGCHDTFNVAVRALLTAEQQVIWDNFLANPPAKDGDKGRDKGGDKGRDGGRKDKGHGRGHHR